jgi:amidohydrolase
VFQPAEEEGLGGKLLVSRGVLRDKPKADAAFALHGWPDFPEGTVISRPGVLMASADRFTIKVAGEGAHGAMPHLSADPVVVSSDIIQGLQTIVSRRVPPGDAAVITVGSIHGGIAGNAIPDHVFMEGTVRYLKDEIKDVIKKHMRRVIEGCCSPAGATWDFEYEEGYIPLVNDPVMVDLGRRIAEKYLGKKSWIEADAPTMGAEDFAFFLDEVPGAFFWLGLGKDSPQLHSPVFDFNDKVIEKGVTFLTGLALEFLSIE